MMTSNPIEEATSWQNAYPTPEELHLSGGLQVEDWPHARQVMNLSTQLFDATFSLHHFDDRQRRLLERAALLHNTGLMVEARRHHKQSFRLIKATSLPDFSDAERHEIACIARYHRRALPSINHEEYAELGRAARKRVSILSSILRVADALDYHHDRRVLRLEIDPAGCNDTAWAVLVTVRPLADLDVELEQVHEKADLFERVFKRKLSVMVRHEEN
jgi:exopolyphosphatase/pppGpp-phosphohydrolase